MRPGDRHPRAALAAAVLGFKHPEQNIQPAVNDAYRAKYARYGDTHLQPMLAAGAVAVTLRLTPRN